FKVSDFVLNLTKPKLWRLNEILKRDKRQYKSDSKDFNKNSRTTLRYLKNRENEKEKVKTKKEN
uniref:hypothetical protein n=1 Tax=Cysteiniphilum marinum TaxID=2774191 RepID=UPI001CE3081E